MTNQKAPSFFSRGENLVFEIVTVRLKVIIHRLFIIIFIFLAGCSDGDKPSSGEVVTQETTSPVGLNGNFSFAVFGDLNSSECERNQYVHEIVGLMADTQGVHHAPVDFFLQTGDLVEGFGNYSCFATDPGGCDYSGNVQDQLQPLIDKSNPFGLKASFFPVIGNHEWNGGSDEWYPDPCGDGICDLLNMNHNEMYSTYINHGDDLEVDGFYNHTLNHGDICEKNYSGLLPYRRDFYYSFTLQNSYFIILEMTQDDYSMLDCQNHPGYDNCEDYCSDESLLLDNTRLNNCFKVYQYDWLVSELRKANEENHENIFVFAHVPILSSGTHPTRYHTTVFRDLFEKYNVDIYFNGHNHAYERTHPVSGDQIDETGTTYITTGTGGASVDGNSGDWFTARRVMDWAQQYNYRLHTTSYLVITVEGGQITGDVYTLDETLTPDDTDHFVLGKTFPSCSDQGGNICAANQSCNGTVVGSSDSGKCCVGTCETSQDSTPPTISNISPASTTTETSPTISFNTNENATCRYAASAGVSYNDMTNEFAGAGGTAHSIQATGLMVGNTYNYYVKCRDGSDNTIDDNEITFSVIDTLPAFPGAEGWGADTPGGRGGQVIHVINLNDDGPGSLRYACEDVDGPRIVVFDISGIIQLHSPITIKDPYITIAGETAPEGGITLYGLNGGLHTVWMSGSDPAVQVHDMIIRFLRIRGATDGDQGDALRLYNAQNVIIDHCSFAWASDETADLSHSKDLTLQWNIVSDSVYDHNSSNQHNLGVLHNFGSAARFSMHHNLLANHNFRYPVYGSDDIDIRNNVMYNWRDGVSWHSDTYASTIPYPHDANIVGNYYKKGPDSRTNFTSNKPIHITPQGDAHPFRYYINGNYYESTDGSSTADQAQMLFPNGTTTWDNLGVPLAGTPNITTQSYDVAYDFVLDKSGSWPRDALDYRAVSETITGGVRGVDPSQWKTISSISDDVNAGLLFNGLNFSTHPAGFDTDNDGMPNDWETARGLHPNTADHNGDDDNDGYTNIEEYLHYRAGLLLK